VSEPDDPQHRPLAGIRVIELATYFFVPSCGAALADWGADVIKVEHPLAPDPLRGLVNRGLGAGEEINYLFEQANRSVRSIGIDVRHADGLELLHQLLATADVFLTSLLPPVMERLGLDPDPVRRRHPRLVYARGTGHGAHGPERGKGGMDFGTFWGRSGLLNAVSDAGREPIVPPPACGDGLSGQIFAGGIAAALLQRERTGTAPLVDVSLLACGVWGMSADVVASKLYGFDGSPPMNPYAAGNPLVHVYRTSDDGWLSMVLFETDRYWPILCGLMERQDLVDDPRFADHESRMTNAAVCIELLDAEFATRTLDQWCELLEPLDGVWEPVRRASDIHRDRQAEANHYLVTVDAPGRTPLTLVASPVMFDETPPHLGPAPTHGQHTEEIMLELGLSWDEIIARKDAGVVL
jgi:crotonobetainyl-CoA:carnitine CoA-transferase CaiB-like acyl-CoA transferase